MTPRSDEPDTVDEDPRDPVESDGTNRETTPASEQDAARSRAQGDQIIDHPSTDESSDPTE
ncbi:MAG: hypothetical protein S0880_04990 [Actinomycetota bacterium]|nr:hypothetical protein [Actinomycetota bacterium]